MFSDILRVIASGRELYREQLHKVIEGIRDDAISEPMLSAFLMGLTTRGATFREIQFLAEGMRANAVRVVPQLSRDAIDTCGTGGGTRTFNVSTANSLLVAAAGVPVAKHGSRSISSSSGSADVLESLDIPIGMSPESARMCLERFNFAFFYAPLYHPVMMKIFPVEQNMGIKTVFFTLIGPLINPCSVQRHVLGVYRNELVDTIAAAAVGLSYKHLLLVHGEGQLDEISVVGPSRLVEVRGTDVHEFTISPGDIGLQTWGLSDLQGGSPEFNASQIEQLLSGRAGGARRDFLLANAGAALYVAGAADTIRQGVEQAAELIEQRAGEMLLASLRETMRNVTQHVE